MSVCTAETIEFPGRRNIGVVKGLIFCVRMRVCKISISSENKNIIALRLIHEKGNLLKPDMFG
jgi:hypothetical protein